MKIAIFFIMILLFGCAAQETPKQLEQPQPAPQPTKIWGDTTPKPQPSPQPEPQPTPLPTPQPSPGAQPIPIIDANWISVFISCPGDYVTVVAKDNSASIAGAEVIAYKDCSNQFTFSTKTNNDGRGVLPDLEPGRYCIKATKTGYTEINKEIMFGSGQYSCSGASPSPAPQPSPTPQPEPQPTSCTDSDGGKTYTVKGTTKKGTETKIDYCFTTNPKTVNEYYCNVDETIGSEIYTCPDTCSDGSCTAATPSPEPEDRCTTNTGCGYKKACISGECVSVQCTTDAQCTGCRRCSGYSCVRCGYGAAGYCSC